MKTNLKIPSFTLQETLVVLLLTAILAGLVFYALRFVQKDTHRLQERAKFVNETELFSQILQADLNNLVFFDVREKELNIEYGSNENEKIVWRSEENVVVRTCSTNPEENKKFPLNITFGSVTADFNSASPLGNLVVYIAPLRSDTLITPNVSSDDLRSDSLYFTILLSSEMVVKSDTFSLIKKDSWH